MENSPPYLHPAPHELVKVRPGGFHFFLYSVTSSRTVITTSIYWASIPKPGSSHKSFFEVLCCCSVAQPCPTLWYRMYYSTPGFPILHNLPEFAQTNVHWIGDGVLTNVLLIHLLSSYFESGGILGTYSRSRDRTDETPVSTAGLLHTVNQAQLQGVQYA